MQSQKGDHYLQRGGSGVYFPVTGCFVSFFCEIQGKSFCSCLSGKVHQLHPQPVPPRHPLPGLQASPHAHLHLAPQLPAPPLRRQQPLPVAPFPDFQAPSSSIPFPLVLLHPPGLRPAPRRRPVFGAPISERLSAPSTSGPAPVQSASSVPSASAPQQLDPPPDDDRPDEGEELRSGWKQ